MNLIFEGLKRQKESISHNTQGIDTSVIEATCPEVLNKDNDVQVNCQTDPIEQQREKYRHLFGKSINSSTKKTVIFTEEQPSTDSKQAKAPKSASPLSEDQESFHSVRLKKLKKQIWQPKVIQSEQSASLKHSTLSFVGQTISVFESIIFAPFRFLRFLCGAPLSNLHFYSDSIVSFLKKSAEFIGHSFVIFAHGCTKAIYFIGSSIFKIQPLFASVWEKISTSICSFCQIFCDVVSIIKNKIKENCVSIINVYRNAWGKLLSIRIPINWIQNATSLLIRGVAIAMSCYVVFLASDAFFSSDNQSGQITLDQATPRRKLKHFFRDPLVLQQKKISSTLLSMHVDSVQRDDNGEGQIVIDDQTYGLGTQIMEHPRIWLEKVGRRSLYFSDKYGQMYKRSIKKMLE